jgi:hypothetical protein
MTQTMMAAVYRGATRDLYTRSPHFNFFRSVAMNVSSVRRKNVTTSGAMQKRKTSVGSTETYCCPSSVRLTAVSL